VNIYIFILVVDHPDQSVPDRRINRITVLTDMWVHYI